MTTSKFYSNLCKINAFPKLAAITAKSWNISSDLVGSMALELATLKSPPRSGAPLGLHPWRFYRWFGVPRGR